jgi:hypothetical protein
MLAQNSWFAIARSTASRKVVVPETAHIDACRVWITYPKDRISDSLLALYDSSMMV